MTVTNKEPIKLKYSFPLKSTGDLTTSFKLLEVLGLKSGEYTFSGVRNCIEVVKDSSWEEFLNNKIKELGFEDILQGKSYTSKETEDVSLSDTYSTLDSINNLHNKIYRLYGKGNKINIKSTEIDHVKNTVKTTFSLVSNSNIDATDYAVALSIYNRQFHPVDSNGFQVMDIDDLINLIPDEDMVKGLKAIKSIFFQ